MAVQVKPKMSSFYLAIFSDIICFQTISIKMEHNKDIDLIIALFFPGIGKPRETDTIIQDVSTSFL